MIFLSIDDVRNEFSNIIYPGGIPGYINDCVHPFEEGQRIFDYKSALSGGGEWLFSEWADMQPEAYSVIAESEVSIFVGEKVWLNRLDNKRRHWLAVGFVGLGEKILPFQPYFKGFSADTASGGSTYSKRYFSLPIEISRSYYYRVDGFEVAHSFPLIPMASRVLPSRLTCWSGVSGFCRKDTKSRAAMRDALRGVLSPGFDEGAVEGRFKIFLDTRPQEDYGLIGDVFIVQEDVSGSIFHVRDGNFSDMKVLDRPSSAVDSYVAGVLRGGVEKFDFSPYLKSI